MESQSLNIGVHIAALRKAKGLTQEQLAARIGVSAPAVSKWETGNSYPDITLLCPLARALGTHVDTLLQFEETLSDQQVNEQINAILQTAMHQNCAAAEAQLETLLHRYPNCTTLQFNAAVAYDTFLMLNPAGQEQWRSRKQTLLEEVRASGSGAYWQIATIQLATMAIAEGDLEQGGALLRELPERPGDPSAIWALYYLKKGQPEEALKLTQKQLYKLANQMVSCLTTLMNPELSPQPRQLLKLCQAYQTLAQIFGLPDMSSAPLMEYYIRVGEIDQAAACFARYVDVATGPVVYPDEELFSPGLPAQKHSDLQATPQPLRQMLLQAVTSEKQYRPLFACPAFTAALEKLKASISSETASASNT